LIGLTDRSGPFDLLMPELPLGNHDAIVLLKASANRFGARAATGKLRCFEGNINSSRSNSGRISVAGCVAVTGSGKINVDWRFDRWPWEQNPAAGHHPHGRSPGAAVDPGRIGAWFSQGRQASYPLLRLALPGDKTRGLGMRGQGGPKQKRFDVQGENAPALFSFEVGEISLFSFLAFR